MMGQAASKELVPHTHAMEGTLLQYHVTHGTQAEDSD